MHIEAKVIRFHLILTFLPSANLITVIPDGDTLGAGVRKKKLTKIK